MSLPSDLLTKFDESMVKAGYTDRSKALQTAIHSLLDGIRGKPTINLKELVHL